MTCQHPQLLVESTNAIRCSRCSNQWRDTQALHLLINKIEFLEKRFDYVEKQLMEQVNLGLGELGLEPCESCGHYMRDLNFAKHGPLNPKRVKCHFGTKGIHIRIGGDCIMCSNCLMRKLNTHNAASPRFEREDLHAIAFWIVRNFGDARRTEVLRKIPHPHQRIAELVKNCINDVMVMRVRGV
jgi:hypothetical protein